MSIAGKGVQVLIRFRPLNDTERAKGPDNCVELSSTTEIAVVGDSFVPPTSKAQGALDIALDQQKQFTFDHVFNPDAGQTDVYETVGRPVVTNVLKGYNGTILAYGQTGSGKTHSMLGPEGGTMDVLSQAGPHYAKRGIIPRLIEDLFARLQAMPEQEVSWKIGVSVFELYKEQIQDLLAQDGAPAQEYKIREDLVGGRGVYVENLYAKPCLSAPELLEAVKLGVSRRKVASTKSNDNSSRSHSLTMIMVEQTNHVQGGTVTRSRLNLIDLAGSEKVRKTQADGERLKEAQQINLSLTFLGNVINKLTDGKGGFIPYRDSKLTRILQDSLGGNSLTTLFCHCSIASYNREETVGTLRFAARAKRIKNAPKVNRELSQKELTLQLAQALDRIKFLEERAALQHGMSPIRQSRINRSSSDRHEDPHNEEAGDMGSPNQIAANEERDELRQTIESLLQQLEEVKRDLNARDEDLGERTQQVEFYKKKAAVAEEELADVVGRAKRDESLLQRKLLDAQSEISQLQQQLELQKASLMGSSANKRDEKALSQFEQDVGQTQHRTPINRPMNLRRPGANPPRSSSTGGPVELSVSGKGQLTSAETMEGIPSGRNINGLSSVATVTELSAASVLKSEDITSRQQQTNDTAAKRQRGPAGSATSGAQLSSTDGSAVPTALEGVQVLDTMDGRPHRGPTPPTTPISGELAPRGRAPDVPKPEMVDCGVMAVVGKTDQELQKEIDDMQTHMKQLMSKSAAINKQFAESKDQLSKLSDMLEATRSERDDVSQELEALRKLLESKEKDNELMRRIMEDLNINLSDFQHLLSDEKTRAKHLLDEADGLRGHNAALKQTAEQQEFVDMAMMELLIKAEDMEAIEQDLMRMPSLPTEELFLKKRDFCLSTLRQLSHFLDNISGQLSRQKFNTGNLESRRLQLLGEAAGLTSRCDDANGLLTFSEKSPSPTH
jgi:hypothetical protein